MYAFLRIAQLILYVLFIFQFKYYPTWICIILFVYNLLYAYLSERKRQRCKAIINIIHMQTFCKVFL